MAGHRHDRDPGGHVHRSPSPRRRRRTSRPPSRPRPLCHATGRRRQRRRPRHHLPRHHRRRRLRRRRSSTAAYRPRRAVEQLALDRLLDIHQSAGDVTISDLTLQGGYHAEAGGAIANASSGTVRLQQCRRPRQLRHDRRRRHLQRRAARVRLPRAVRRRFPRLELIDVDVIGNETGGAGGGVYVEFGTLSVNRRHDSPDNHAGDRWRAVQRRRAHRDRRPQRRDARRRDVRGQRRHRVPAAASSATTSAPCDHRRLRLRGNTAYDYGGAVAVGVEVSRSPSPGYVHREHRGRRGGGASTWPSSGRCRSRTRPSRGNDAGKTLPEPRGARRDRRGRGWRRRRCSPAVAARRRHATSLHGQRRHRRGRRPARSRTTPRST